MPAEGPRPLGPDSIGLAKGLVVALRQLRVHQADGMRVNINAVKKDKVILYGRACTYFMVPIALALVARTASPLDAPCF